VLHIGLGRSILGSLQACGSRLANKIEDGLNRIRITNLTSWFRINFRKEIVNIYDWFTAAVTERRIGRHSFGGCSAD
jgi:hypothetical protein